MYVLDKIKKQIAEKVNETLGEKKVRPSDLVTPPRPDFGDLSLSCFGLSGKKGGTPNEAAERLVSGIRAEGVIAGVAAVGPYVNFSLRRPEAARMLVGQVAEMGGAYGTNKGGRGKRVGIEYSNANTHKEYHVGHLRNLCFGDAVNRILAANGYKSIPISYINDFGIHIAKTLWAYSEYYREEKLPENKGYFLGKVYARASAEAEDDPQTREKIGAFMQKIESRKGEEYELWRKTREWSIEQFARVYRRLGVEFAHTFYESELIGAGLDLVSELYRKEFLVKSDGAIIKDLTAHDLGVLLFLRSDGTALYPVADLPLAMAKFDKLKLDKSVYVVDVRQSLYFRQLFKTLELLGYRKEMLHLSYEFVKLPEGMISSRSGRVIAFEDLWEAAFAKAKEETARRHKDWSGRRISEVAAAVTRGVIKFEMIKVNAGQIITFDISQALRFDGFTAAYLQYACARVSSILKKAGMAGDGGYGKEGGDLPYEKITAGEEHGLVMKLAAYPEAVARAGEKYDPSEIARYLFDLARVFNDYYHEVPVLKAENGLRRVRLLLIAAVRQTLANGLGLLGIDDLPEM